MCVIKPTAGGATLLSTGPAVVFPGVCGPEKRHRCRDLNVTGRTRWLVLQRRARTGAAGDGRNGGLLPIPRKLLKHGNTPTWCGSSDARNERHELWHVRASRLPGNASGGPIALIRGCRPDRLDPVRRGGLTLRVTIRSFGARGAQWAGRPPAAVFARVGAVVLRGKTTACAMRVL